MIQQRKFLTYILLSIITCGIYSIIFWYSLTEDINRACQGDGENTPNYILVILLSFVTCGIYTYYWYYKLGDRLNKNGPRYGIQINENGGTMLLWSLLGTFLCFLGLYYVVYLIIKNSNLIFDGYNRSVFGGGNGGPGGTPAGYFPNMPNGYGAPSGYNAPNGYNMPNNGYNAPNGYNMPNNGYNAPNGYNMPNNGYNAQNRGYNAPNNGYNAPQNNGYNNGGYNNNNNNNGGQQ